MCPHTVLQTWNVCEQGVGPAASSWRVGSLGTLQCLFQVLRWRNQEHDERLQQAWVRRSQTVETNKVITKCKSGLVRTVAKSESRELQTNLLDSASPKENMFSQCEFQSQHGRFEVIKHQSNKSKHDLKIESRAQRLCDPSSLSLGRGTVVSSVWVGGWSFALATLSHVREDGKIFAKSSALTLMASTSTSTVYLQPSAGCPSTVAVSTPMSMSAQNMSSRIHPATQCKYSMTGTLDIKAAWHHIYDYQHLELCNPLMQWVCTVCKSVSPTTLWLFGCNTWF